MSDNHIKGHENIRPIQLTEPDPLSLSCKQLLDNIRSLTRYRGQLVIFFYIFPCSTVHVHSNFVMLAFFLTRRLGFKCPVKYFHKTWYVWREVNCKQQYYETLRVCTCVECYTKWQIDRLTSSWWGGCVQDY